MNTDEKAKTLDHGSTSCRDATRDGTGTVPYDGVQLVQASSHLVAMTGATRQDTISNHYIMTNLNLITIILYNAYNSEFFQSFFLSAAQFVPSYFSG